MAQTEYGIYRISSGGNSVWLENSNSLQNARSRVGELARKFHASFAVYDLRNLARPVFELKEKLQ